MTQGKPMVGPALALALSRALPTAPPGLDLTVSRTELVESPDAGPVVRCTVRLVSGCGRPQEWLVDLPVPPVSAFTAGEFVVHSLRTSLERWSQCKGWAAPYSGWGRRLDVPPVPTTSLGALELAGV